MSEVQTDTTLKQTEVANKEATAETSTQLSTAERLRRARQAHEALRRAASRPPSVSAVSEASSAKHEAPPISSVASLASQLDAFYQCVKSRQSADGQNANDQRQLDRLRASLEKIGADEKNDLVLFLLQQVDGVRAQRNDATALGEHIAAQLVRQQHELRQKCRERVDQLESELHQALHAHPEVTALRSRVQELTDANRDLEQQLRFSVVKLQRSRKRERELQRLHDPLWDM